MMVVRCSSWCRWLSMPFCIARWKLSSVSTIQNLLPMVAVRWLVIRFGDCVIVGWFIAWGVTVWRIGSSVSVVGVLAVVKLGEYCWRHFLLGGLLRMELVCFWNSMLVLDGVWMEIGFPFLCLTVLPKHIPSISSMKIFDASTLSRTEQIPCSKDNFLCSMYALSEFWKVTIVKVWPALGSTMWKGGCVASPVSLGHFSVACGYWLWYRPWR